MGVATAGELAALLPIARPGVSRHLRVLREAGLVDVQEEAQRRVYSLRPSRWIAFYGAGWQIHAENLAAYLARREPEDVEARWTALVPPYQDLAANIG